jgi:hypothetical protein
MTLSKDAECHSTESARSRCAVHGEDGNEVDGLYYCAETGRWLGLKSPPPARNVEAAMTPPDGFPGPWRVERDWSYEVYAANGALVAKCPTGQASDLIAATPALIARVRELEAGLREVATVEQATRKIFTEYIMNKHAVEWMNHLREELGLPLLDRDDFKAERRSWGESIDDGTKEQP